MSEILINKADMDAHADEITEAVSLFVEKNVGFDYTVTISGYNRLQHAHSSAKSSRNTTIERLNKESGYIKMVANSMDEYDDNAIDSI